MSALSNVSPLLPLSPPQICGCLSKSEYNQHSLQTQTVFQAMTRAMSCAMSTLSQLVKPYMILRCQVEDLSKLPANVSVELLPPAADSGDLRPRFVVAQHEGKVDMLQSLDSSSNISADEVDYNVLEDDDDGLAGTSELASP